MKKITVVILVFLQINCFGQESIKFNLIPSNVASNEYDKVELETKNKDLIKNKEYFIYLGNINSAYYDVKINPTLSNIKSIIPDVLKPILPGIPDNNLIADMKVLDQKSGLPATIQSSYDEARHESIKLEKLVKSSKELKEHIVANKNDASTCAAKAQFFLSELGSSSVFGTGTPVEIDKLKEKVKNSTYIFLANWEASKLLLEGNPIPPSGTPYQTANELNEVLKAMKEFNQYNQFIIENKDKFINIVDFIFATSKAEDFKRTKPFTNNKDLTTVSFVVTNKLNGDTLLKHNEELFTTGGWKLDFTTGFFYNTINNNDFFLEVAEDGTKSIKNERNPKSDLAIGALAHFAFRALSNLKIGPSIGPAVSPLDGKIRYLGGLSFVVGRRNQLAISGGAALAKIKVLSGKVSRNGEEPLDIIPADVTSVPTYEKHKWGIFLGVSYNLTAK